jgi:hypothetical protein
MPHQHTQGGHDGGAKLFERTLLDGLVDSSSRWEPPELSPRPPPTPSAPGRLVQEPTPPPHKSPHPLKSARKTTPIGGTQGLSQNYSPPRVGDVQQRKPPVIQVKV